MKKKGIDAWASYDKQGEWVLNIAKKRGKLTVEEIEDAAREYEIGVYILFVDARERGDPTGWETDKIAVPNTDGTVTEYSDLVRLYEADNYPRKEH